MDDLEFMGKVISGAMYLFVGVAVFMIVVGIPMSLLSNVGTTQVDGYVVRVSQESFPWEATTVKFTLEHPTSIVDATYYSRTYGGHHGFELGTRYRITAYREWCWYYPKIVEVEVLES